MAHTETLLEELFLTGMSQLVQRYTGGPVSTLCLGQPMANAHLLCSWTEQTR